jgi:hypothetical protein
MDVATSSTPQRGVSYAPSCEGRERSVGIASSENGANARYRVNSSTWPDSTHPATQLSNGCAHTSVGMTGATDTSATLWSGKLRRERDRLCGATQLRTHRCNAEQSGIGRSAADHSQGVDPWAHKNFVGDH